MTKDECRCNHKKGYRAGGGDAVYGIGVVGAIFYYITTATGFWLGVFGVVKAFFWPAFVVFELMKHLQM